MAVQDCGCDWALDLSAWEPKLWWDKVTATNMLHLSVFWVKSSLAGCCNPWFCSSYLRWRPSALSPRLNFLLSWLQSHISCHDAWKTVSPVTGGSWFLFTSLTGLRKQGPVLFTRDLLAEGWILPLPAKCQMEALKLLFQSYAQALSHACSPEFRCCRSSVSSWS